ncbi:tc5 transposase [Oesophagostomum dentatum]|uniref:Tc5 transposase n=1 Tax=Oesophagostomum dentatum TaxID=61180 RepID=A0A0B1SNK6_OESDE|nr:tc5 transposase [Oesophagostomum dentatum]
MRAIVRIGLKTKNRWKRWRRNGREINPGKGVCCSFLVEGWCLKIWFEKQWNITGPDKTNVRGRSQAPVVDSDFYAPGKAETVEDEDLPASEAEDYDSSDWVEDEQEAEKNEKKRRKANKQPWQENMLQFSGGRLVRRAVEYHWSNKKRDKGRSRSSTCRRFRFLRTKHDFVKLKKYYDEGVAKISTTERLNIIKHRMTDLIEEKIRAGIRLHDCDLQQMAMNINANLNHPIQNFKASRMWIVDFKKNIGVSLRAHPMRRNITAEAISSVNGAKASRRDKNDENS